jgi:hypothetical protein
MLLFFHAWFFILYLIDNIICLHNDTGVTLHQEAAQGARISHRIPVMLVSSEVCVLHDAYISFVLFAMWSKI